MILFGLLFGFLQGLRHAFEPDHVIAVSTMLTEQRTTRERVGYASAWGAGHAGMLLLVGIVLLLLRGELPERLDALFELGVSVMLIGLGVRALRNVVRTHQERRPTMRWRALGPLAMGMVHGLAGSGALTALVMARLPSSFAAITFIVLFGVGATLGMSLLAGVAGAPLARLMRTRWGMPVLLATTGAISVALGLSWIGGAVLRLVRA